MKRGLVITLLALSCTVAVASAAARTGPAAKRLRVTSSLDGKTVLPHRLRWLAVPHLNGAATDHVTYLIDGNVRWITNEAP